MPFSFRSKKEVDPSFSRLEDEDADAPKDKSMSLPGHKSDDGRRIEKFLDGMPISKEMASKLDMFKPAIIACVKGLLYVAPYYHKAFTYGYDLYRTLPMNVLQMIFGAALCFFGGTYVASIAAIEAFRQLGWEKVKHEIDIIQEQAAHARAASKEDDQVDADGNGRADVLDMEADKFVKHKITVVMTAIKEPERLQTACGSLFGSYLAVLATLRLEFARTTAFALGIVEMAKFPVIRILSPMLAPALGEEMMHWTQTIIETSLTFIAVIFAWWLQMIISAFYSGLRGGRMFADALCVLLVEKDLMKNVPMVEQPFDADESIFDEVVGYSIAAVGFIFQVSQGFSLPFPLNLVFLPLSIIEWFLRFQISMESTTPMAG